MERRVPGPAGTPPANPGIPAPSAPTYLPTPPSSKKSTPTNRWEDTINYGIFNPDSVSSCKRFESYESIASNDSGYRSSSPPLPDWIAGSKLDLLWPIPPTSIDSEYPSSNRNYTQHNCKCTS